MVQIGENVWWDNIPRGISSSDVLSGYLERSDGGDRLREPGPAAPTAVTVKDELVLRWPETQVQPQRARIAVKNPHKCPSVRLFSHWLSLSSQMVFDGVCVIRTHTFPHKHTCRSNLESIKNHPNVHIFSKCHIDGLELNPKRSCYDAMMLTSFSPWIKQTRTKSLSYKYQISQQLLEYFQQPNIATWHTSLCF